MNKKGIDYIFGRRSLSAVLVVGMALVFMASMQEFYGQDSDAIHQNSVSPGTETGNNSLIEPIIVATDKAPQKMPAVSAQDTETIIVSSQTGTEHADTRNIEDPSSPVSRPTEQQMEYQRFLEQKIYGDIQVMGPLLPEILKSEEFSRLTENQRMSVLSLIVTRLNKGELKAEDVYPGRRP